jgi:hypothetical protein
MLGALCAACSAGGSGGEGLLDDTGSASSSSPSATSTAPPILIDPGGGPGSSIDPSAPGASGCNDLEIKFEREIPTVMFIVDRSSSMFDYGYWEPLKTAVLAVVSSLEHDVRFGLAAYTGVNGGTCPMLNVVDAFALGNAAAISAAYAVTSVDPRTESGGQKTETPTMRAIEAMIPKLAAEEGAKYFVLVTDGEPDFCNDGQEPCAKDQSVAAVQAARTQGIGTFVLGLGNDVHADHLQDLANAGAGLPVRHPGQDLSWCGSNPLHGTYESQGGNATVFAPAVNEAALTEQLKAVVSGVKSCVFELQGKLEVDPEQAFLGKVVVGGEQLQYNDPNGWQLKGANQIELVGEACRKLQEPTATGISFDFPCRAVIVR